MVAVLSNSVSLKPVNPQVSVCIKATEVVSVSTMAGPSVIAISALVPHDAVEV